MGVKPDKAHAVLSGPSLRVDLAALADNYRLCRELGGKAEAGAVVKADAYGLGVEPVARTLYDAGCRTFFTAFPGDGARLRAFLPRTEKAAIYILNGLAPGSARICEEEDLRPCLTGPDQIEAWRRQARRAGRRLHAALHFDTGINRLGLSAAEAGRIAENPSCLDGIEVDLLMSHLACADLPDDPMNRVQLKKFHWLLERLASCLPQARASLSNTSGLSLGDAFSFDLTRAGIGLYGGNPSLEGAGRRFAPVLGLSSFIAQLRRIAPGEKIGYGGAFTAREPMTVAVVPVGYASGLPRTLWSGGGQAVIANARAPIAARAPIVGRVSMDMIMIDVSALEDGIAHENAAVELLGRHITIDDLASAAGTIPHEIAIGLGRCAHKEYRTQHMPSASRAA